MPCPKLQATPVGVPSLCKIVYKNGIIYDSYSNFKKYHNVNHTQWADPKKNLFFANPGYVPDL